jgi:heterodisulfide reductase subunit B
MLDIEIKELDNWNCCGATAYMSVDEMKALGLSARNLALAEARGIDLVAPCAACYGILIHTWDHMEKYPQRGDQVKAGLDRAGLKYDGKVHVRHPLDVLVNDIGIDKIKEKVVRPLNGLKVASYYGCRILRPVSTFDDPDNPTSMDVLMTAIGATPVNYPLKTKCCSASHTGTLPEVGQQMSGILIREMEKRGADIIATACPLCQFNLEVFQEPIIKRFPEIKPIPVVSFTQLMAYAMGMDEKIVCFKNHTIKVEPVLKDKVVAELVGAK